MSLDWQPVTEHADQLGESPFWLPGEGALYWVDIPGRQVKRMREGGDVEAWAMPSEPGCIAPIRGGGFVIALRDGVYRANSWGEAPSVVAQFAHDPATTRFNDGKADTLGRFWAGTMYEPRDARKAELYCVDVRPGNGAGGAPIVQVKAGNATIANGLAWSPDQRTIYWTDTTAHVIGAWNWDWSTGDMNGHRVFHQFPGKPADWKPGMPGYGGRPDGAAVDIQGNYWCAMFEGQRLLQLSPKGDVLAELSLPVRCPTMPCFGGADLRTLYVTSASYNRQADELRELPWSGRVIAARVEVPGLPVNFVSA